jgi:hypothetical protein
LAIFPRKKITVSSNVFQQARRIERIPGLTDG